MLLSPTRYVYFTSYAFLASLICSFNFSFFICSGCKITIGLWGEAAMRFNGQVIHFLGQDEAAIAIFVGATVETFGGMAPSTFILVYKIRT
jgi:hypothetical protein